MGGEVLCFLGREKTPVKMCYFVPLNNFLGITQSATELLNGTQDLTTGLTSAHSKDFLLFCSTDYGLC